MLPRRVVGRSVLLRVHHRGELHPDEPADQHHHDLHGHLLQEQQGGGPHVAAHLAQEGEVPAVQFAHEKDPGGVRHPGLQFQLRHLSVRGHASV